MRFRMKELKVAFLVAVVAVTAENPRAFIFFVQVS